MAKSYFCTCLAVASCLWGLVAPIFRSDAYAAECLRKTAGFYLADMNVSSAHNLRALQNLSGSLTGLPGNPELGRDVFVNAQKGGCVSCHQLSTLPAAIAQGSVGPALDGAGSKYSEGQLRQVLLQPEAYFPETIMPSYHRPGEAAESVLTAAEVEDLVAYLGTLK